jgi:hypothetical protein
MDGRFNAQHKLAAECLLAWRVGHFLAFRVDHFNHFFHCRAKFGASLRLVVTVNTARLELGAIPNEALFLIAPFDKLRVARHLLFDLLGCHNPIQDRHEDGRHSGAASRRLAGAKEPFNFRRLERIEAPADFIQITHKAGLTDGEILVAESNPHRQG